MSDTNQIADFTVLNFSEEYMAEFDSTHTCWEVVTSDGELFLVSHQSKVMGKDPECMAFVGVEQGDRIIPKSWNEVAVSRNPNPYEALIEVMSTILGKNLDRNPDQVKSSAADYVRSVKTGDAFDQSAALQH